MSKYLRGFLTLCLGFGVSYFANFETEETILFFVVQIYVEVVLNLDKPTPPPSPEP